ncbi:MAG: diaminopimelate decarboxylase [Bryobacteraceae bacterium]|nr:diaminopimelate decarboxylase [Bryobacteraceae bacterium]MDW8379989.1 diaminopimelate decarboxylase [Bryobacterales bacterium]
MGKAWEYRNNLLYLEDVALDEVAERVGTPCYVYSSQAILSRYEAYDRSFGEVPHRICYAVKANSNLSVLGLLAKVGAGFDIVSGGELFRALRAGANPASIVFSGVGKTREEIEYALESGIHAFHCESEPELALIESLAARLNKQARVALRVNPDVDASTHPYISTGLKEHKFGIDIGEVEGVYDRARSLRHVRLEGVSCHIGSQLLNVDPLLESMDRMLALVERLRAAGLPIQSLDLGGGVGVPYQPGDPEPSIEEFIEKISQKAKGRNLMLMVEPGRSLVAEAGVLLSRVLYRKRNGAKDFIIVDAAMNDLIRPSLYQAHHEIIPVRRDERRGAVVADVVGPVCESGDFLARNRHLANVLPGDLVAICTAGAYGFVLSSNYNSRPRAAEVLVAGAQYKIARQRESYEDLIRGEQ